LNELIEPGNKKPFLQTVENWSALLWLIIVIIGYYVMHKPITPFFIVSLLSLAWRLTVAVGIISAAGGLGYRYFKDITYHPLSALSIQAAFGLGVLALGVMAVGYLGVYYGWIALLALILLVFITWRNAASWWKQWGFLISEFRASNMAGKLLAILILIVLLATLSIALSPPLQFDALVYHLSLPQEYLHDHQLSYVANNFFWGMPQIAEMIYTWSMALGGAQTATVTGWFAGLIALMGIQGLISNRFSPNTAWVGTATLAAGFTLAFSLGWAYVDWWVLLFASAYFACMLQWVEIGSVQLLAVSGIFAGMAFGTKYTAGILLLCGAVVILLKYHSSYQVLFKSLIAFGAPAFLIFSPWLLKNYLATGNPVYPLGFPAGEVTQLRLDLYQRGEPWGGWLDLLFLPLRATFWGVHGSPGYSASIGPLFLGLALAVGIGWNSRGSKEKSSIVLAMQLSLTGLILWMIAGRFSSYLLQTRLYLAIFPMLTFLAAAGFNGLGKIVESKIRFKVVVSAMICLVVGLTTLEVSIETLKMDSFRQMLGLKSAKNYLADNLGWFEPAMATLQKLPNGSRVLMLWEPRSFYCAPVCEPDEIIDRWLRERYDGQEKPASADEILQKWMLAGYTHLLYYQAGAEFVRHDDTNYKPQDWSELKKLLTMLPLVDNFGDTYLLFHLQ